jgi:uncharacterized protein YkwD
MGTLWKSVFLILLASLIAAGLPGAGLASAPPDGADLFLPLIRNSTCQDFPIIPPDDLGIEAELAAAINAVRQDNGLAALTLDERLTQAARLHNHDMADNGFISHTGSDGSDPGSRMVRACYTWNAYGEIIGAGYTTVQAMMDGWMNSSGHWAIILSTAYTDFGVSYVDQPGSPYRYYWTVDFGHPK